MHLLFWVFFCFKCHLQPSTLGILQGAILFPMQNKLRHVILMSELEYGEQVIRIIEIYNYLA